MRILTSAIIALLLSISSHALAEQKQTLGPWDVHYMAVSTSFLTPEVAQNYNIQRSKYRALINIAVLDNDTQTPQRVSVTGQAKNLLGTVKSLDFRQVKEGKAIYYLATLPFRNDETYNFDIDIQQGNEQRNLTFKQKFVADE